MKILLTGKTGQVGFELMRCLQGIGEVIAVDRTQMDLANLTQVREIIHTVKPDLIINPAAYTAVDKAETEFELSMRINGEAPAIIAEEAKKLGAGLIHYSTDYVFDGTKATPYSEDDETNPINVYGRTKLAGEQAIAASGCAYLILRTSWVYSMHGKNFLLTMLRLAKERDELKVVDDQWGAPTWAGWIANTTVQMITRRLVLPSDNYSIASQLLPFSGIYNLVNSGSTTWCRFARQIFLEAVAAGKLSKKNIPNVLPIETREYPVPARRPANSRLAITKIQQLLEEPITGWDKSLAECLKSA